MTRRRHVWRSTLTSCVQKKALSIRNTSTESNLKYGQLLQQPINDRWLGCHTTLSCLLFLLFYVLLCYVLLCYAVPCHFTLLNYFQPYIFNIQCRKIDTTWVKCFDLQVNRTQTTIMKQKSTINVVSKDLYCKTFNSMSPTLSSHECQEPSCSIWKYFSYSSFSSTIKFSLHG
jgi:hypothetical protein